MLNCTVKVGDLLQEEADCMLSTANPMLRMSGGVNGAILQRGNLSIQEELDAYISKKVKKFANPGEVVATSPGNLSVKLLLHCVAINAFYHSSSALITKTLESAFSMAAEQGCRSIAMPTLATGYGPLSMTQFSQGLKPLLSRDFGSITDLTIVVLREKHKSEIEDVLELV